MVVLAQAVRQNSRIHKTGTQFKQKSIFQDDGQPLDKETLSKMIAELTIERNNLRRSFNIVNEQRTGSKDRQHMEEEIRIQNWTKEDREELESGLAVMRQTIQESWKDAADCEQEKRSKNNQ